MENCVNPHRALLPLHYALNMQLVLRAAGFQLTPTQAGSAALGDLTPPIESLLVEFQFPRMQCTNSTHNTQQALGSRTRTRVQRTCNARQEHAAAPAAQMKSLDLQLARCSEVITSSPGSGAWRSTSYHVQAPNLRTPPGSGAWRSTSSKASCALRRCCCRISRGSIWQLLPPCLLCYASCIPHSTTALKA